jgi:phytanoyl-CoA hydroxylase
MQNPQSFYDSEGYYIFRNLIPNDAIEKLLKKYHSQILPSKNNFFRQSSNRWETNKLSSSNYCEESFLDVHDYPNYPSFTEAVRRILCSPEVREALTRLTGGQEHNLMQSMLFDMNTATPAHQDWYYLDSLPNGHLLAGWFALEDIHEEAGRFYVLPKSHMIDFDLTEDEKIANAPYVAKLKNYIDSHKDDIYAPALQKGDVLFWNSRTIHGSTKTLNLQYSRKSLTAHYLPSKYEFGNRYATSPGIVDYASYEGMNYRLAPPHQKYYSLSAKVKTEVFQYLWERPKLRRMVNLIKKPLTKLQK